MPEEMGETFKVIAVGGVEFSDGLIHQDMRWRLLKLLDSPISHTCPRGVEVGQAWPIHGSRASRGSLGYERYWLADTKQCGHRECAAAGG